MKRIVTILLVMVMVISVFALSACSSADATEPTAAASEEASASATDEALEEASSEGTGDEALEAELAQYMVVPEFTFDGEAFDAKAVMEGKNMFTVPSSSSVPYAKITTDFMGDIANMIGFENFIYETDGSPDSWVQGIETAVSQQYDLIDLFSGCNTEMLTSQIEMAEDAGIPVVDAHFVDYTRIDKSHGTYVMPAEYKLAGTILAEWAINKRGADEINALVVTARDLDASLAMEEGIDEVFATYAPDATYKYVNVPLTDWATKIQPEVQNALQADPTINYVIAIYDGMLAYVVPAIETVNATETVLCNGYNGTPFALDYIKSGSVDMVLGESLEWIAYTVMDYQMRIMGELDLPEKENPPFYIWTSENVDAAMDEETGQAGYGGYGDAYIEGYAKLWGLE